MAYFRSTVAKILVAQGRAGCYAVRCLEGIMEGKRVIAHFMEESEREAARMTIHADVETDSYVIGIADESQQEQLREQGLIVSPLPDTSEPAPLDELYGVHRADVIFKMRNSPVFEKASFDAVVLEAGTLEAAKPDGTDQYYLVWLQGPLVEEWRKLLLEAGAVPEEAFPTGAYKVRLNSSRLDTVLGLPFVSSIRQLGGLEAAPEIVEPLSQEGDGELAPAKIPFDILLNREPDIPVVLEWLGTRGIAVAGSGGRKIRALFSEDDLLLGELAGLTEVSAIEPYVAPTLHNDRARVLLKIDNGGVPLVETGAGQLVGVADTGIDDSHPDLQARISGMSAWGRPGVTDDPHGHGTHVSGSIAGDGTASGGAIRGVAPGAKLYFQSLIDANGELGGLPINLGQLFEDAHAHGARIHNNSWGSATRSRYTINSSEVDDFVSAKRDMLIVISAGNEGRASPPLANSAAGHVDWLSVGSPASCKNALTVGASRSDRTAGGFSGLTYGQNWTEKFPHPPIADDRISGDPECLAGFSSRGPIDDRRIKPDVVAPGTDIASAKSSIAPLSKFWGAVPGHQGQYGYMGGTSMSAPFVSGCAALVREYLATAQGYEHPSAALIKAMLVNGTRWLSGWDAMAPAVGMPNFHQGFGCINMADTLPNPGRPGLVIRILDDWQTDAGKLAVTGQARRLSFRITGSCESLRICLAYTDLPARALQNNLNLFLQLPGGQKLMGNDGIANRLVLPDPDNNVEIIRLSHPVAGTYRVQVTATNLLRGPQDFALVVSGENVSPLQII